MRYISQTLVEAVCRIAQVDGDFDTAIPQLSLHRRSHSEEEPRPCLYPRGLVLVLQGRKRLVYGKRRVEYGKGYSLLLPVDLPVMSQVVEASAKRPFLGMLLQLDSTLLVQAARETADGHPAEAIAPDSVSMAKAGGGVMEALTRLMQLEREPTLLPHLAPLIKKEIAVRLMTGEHGPTLRSMLIVGSPAQRIALAMRWFGQNFADKTGVDALAAQVGMSPTTFRQHFRQIAGISPLQYQKQLRLQKAKELMLNASIDIANAAARVGYVSLSQFSREYKRFFGESPRRDVRRETNVDT